MLQSTLELLTQPNFAVLVRWVRHTRISPICAQENSSGTRRLPKTARAFQYHSSPSCPQLNLPTKARLNFQGATRVRHSQALQLMSGTCQSHKPSVTCLRRQSSCSHQAWVNQPQLLRCASEEAAELLQSSPWAQAQVCSTTTEPIFISMGDICCKLLINTRRKTLPSLCDAATTAQRLVFDPAGSNPCCHGGSISHLPLALELFTLFVITMGIRVWGEKFLFCSPSSSALGHWVCPFVSLQAVCPKPLVIY